MDHKRKKMLNKDIWSDATKEHPARAQARSSSSTAKSEAIIHENGSTETNSRREPKQVPTLNILYNKFSATLGKKQYIQDSL